MFSSGYGDNPSAQLNQLANKQWCDFIYPLSTAPWTGAALNSGSITSGTGTAKHPGIAVYGSSALANGGAIVKGSAAILLLAGGEKTTFAFKTAATLAGITRRMGFIDSTTTADAVNGAYVEIVDGVLKGKTATNSVYSNTNSTLLYSNTWYRLVEQINFNATQVTYTLYADDSNTVLWQSTLTTNIPTAVGQEVGHADICFYSGTSAITIGYIDYMDLILPNARRIA